MNQPLPDVSRIDVATLPTRDLIARQTRSAVYFASASSVAGPSVTWGAASGADTRRDDDAFGACESFTFSSGLTKDAIIPLAVKVLAPPAAATTDHMEMEELMRCRFHREVSCLYKLRVMRESAAIGDDRNAPLSRMPYLVALEPLRAVAMPYLRACALQRLFYEDGAATGLPFRVVRSVVAQLAVLLRYLHNTCALVHRDVKLPNTAIDEDGRVYLLDFGAACGLGERAEVRCGTAHCQPPELTRTQEDWGSPAQDCYALGILAFELAFGKPPYGFGDVALRTRSDPLRVTRIARGAAKDETGLLVDFVNKMTAFDPAARLVGHAREDPWRPVFEHPLLKPLMGSRGLETTLADLADDGYQSAGSIAEEIEMQLAGF